MVLIDYVISAFGGLHVIYYFSFKEQVTLSLLTLVSFEFNYNDNRHDVISSRYA